jgi:undecaprenyl diphosphate synthase
MDKNPETTIPAHVGIIMDGNRRWAKERNLPTFDGHFKGYQKMLATPDWFFSRGVKVVSFYAFSTENWSRAPEEVSYLMKLLKDGIDEQTAQAEEKDYRILFSGRIDGLPGDLPEACQGAMTKTRDNKRGIVNICLNYGGRAEIVDAIKRMIKNGVDIEQVHEGMVRKYLYNGDLPDPDIIVRTSGEQRLSGFLLWEGAYSELLFIRNYWPDFEATDVADILAEYAERGRRFGGN